MAAESPEISIVVPVRLARETIAHTLQALLDQCAGRDAEVTAVVSRADATREALRPFQSHPRLRVIEMDGARSVPQLRAEGIRASRGALVAITEDHCLFPHDWVERLMAAHRAHPDAAAIGGLVENGRTASLLDWAIYFSRYLVWMPPVPGGPVRQLPGNHASYRREVLEAHRDFFAHGFWEHEFHNRIAARGRALWLDAQLVVTHNKPYGFLAYVALRYRHARCFGAMGAGQPRLRRIVSAPLLPFLLLLRAWRLAAQKRRRRRELLLCSPILLLFYGVWCWGEIVGQLFGPGQTCSQTD